MVRPTDDDIAAAEARGRVVEARMPRAESVRYDGGSGRCVVSLVNGCDFSFPVSLVPALSGASVTELEAVEIVGRGMGLHWPARDLDLTVEGIMAGRFAARGQGADAAA